MLKNNKDWKQQAIALADTGTMSWRQIARILGKSKSTVSDYLRAHYQALDDLCGDGIGIYPPYNAENRVLEEKVKTLLFKQMKGKDEGATQEVFKIETSESAEHLKFPTHFIIPDSQVKPDVDLSYLDWIGAYIVRKKPDVIVHLGDFFDLPSLSSYDKGKKSAEGKRLNEDIEAGLEGMRRLLTPLYNLQQEELSIYGKVMYKPRMVFLYGNHCNRLTRHIESNPELHGFLSLKDLRVEEFGWETVDFLKPITLNGVAYCHYFPNEFTGKPLGGSALNMLKTLGTSFVQGHKQTLDHAVRHLPTNGKQQHGLICGAAYSHDEEYKGMNNAHWRGCVVAHRVNDGAYDPLFVSLDWLREEYGEPKLERKVKKVKNLAKSSMKTHNAIAELESGNGKRFNSVKELMKDLTK